MKPYQNYASFFWKIKVVTILKMLKRQSSRTSIYAKKSKMDWAFCSAEPSHENTWIMEILHIYVVVKTRL